MRYALPLPCGRRRILTGHAAALAYARDAWNLQSWLIWPANERGRVTPDKLLSLAAALSARKLEGPAKLWPDALRIAAAAWEDSQ